MARYTDLPNILNKKSRIQTDADVVRQELERILTTEEGDLIDQPTYGVSLQRYLYELMTENTRIFIEMEVRRALETWMSDVIEVQKIVVSSNVDEHRFTVDLQVYSVEFDQQIVMRVPFDEVP